MSFLNRIFQKKNFSLPLTGQKPIFQVINGKPVFYDVSSDSSKMWLLEKYNKLSEISAIINKIAYYAAAVGHNLQDKQGNPITDRQILDLFKQPNSLEDWQSYYKKIVIQRLLFGESFENAFGYTSPSLKFELKALPPQYTAINISNYTDFRLVDILNYVVKIPNKNTQNIDKDLVLHIKDVSPNFDYKTTDVYGRSRLLSCVKNVQSIESGYNAKVGLFKHGPRVIITGKTQGEFAAANIQTTEDVNQLQDRINNNYGLQENQYAVMITDIPLDVTTVSMDMGQLKVNENNIADFQSICRAYDIDSRVLSDVSSSTFTNVEMAIDAFLNGSFKIFIESDFAQRANFLSKLFKKEIYDIPDFSNIPGIVKAEQANYEKYKNDCFSGLLTRNQYYELIGQETVNNPEFDKYYTFYQGQWIPIGQTNVNQNGQN